ncbi:MAG: ISKra4 family transposase [Thermoplasmata archaeon]
MSYGVICRRIYLPFTTTLDPAHRQFRSLEEWLLSREASGAGLGRVELGVEAQGRELLRLLLQAHVQERGSGDVGPAIELGSPEGGHRRVLPRRKGLRSLRLLTLFGGIRVERLRYAGRQGVSFYPLDEQLQLPARTYSYAVQSRLVKRAVQGPFEEAIDGLRETTGVSIPKRSAQQILVDASRDVDAFYAQRAGIDPRTAGPILVASIDCKGIPMARPGPAPRVVRRGKGEKPNKKRMATVAAVFTMKPRVRTPLQVVESLFNPETRTHPRKAGEGPQNKRVWASLLAGKDAFVEDVKAEVGRRDPRRRKTWVVVADGERALQIRMAHALPGAVIVLDLIHALEKVWSVAYLFHPEGSPEAQAFVRERALRILQGGVGQVVKGLRQMATKRGLRGARRKTLLSVAAYLYHNRSRMRYHAYLARGLPIGSGSVEGACKNLIKDRMERSGMRWSEEGAEAMVKMRAVYLSRDFDQYWSYHVVQEQRRLYPKGVWRPFRSCAKK